MNVCVCIALNHISESNSAALISWMTQRTSVCSCGFVGPVVIEHNIMILGRAQTALLCVCVASRYWRQHKSCVFCIFKVGNWLHLTLFQMDYCDLLDWGYTFAKTVTKSKEKLILNWLIIRSLFSVCKYVYNSSTWTQIFFSSIFHACIPFLFRLLFYSKGPNCKNSQLVKYWALGMAADPTYRTIP